MQTYMPCARPVTLRRRGLRSLRSLRSRRVEGGEGGAGGGGVKVCFEGEEEAWKASKGEDESFEGFEG